MQRSMFKTNILRLAGVCSHANCGWNLKPLSGRSRLAVRFVFALLFSLLAAQVGLAQDRPNVLFVSIDDLRPEIGCYGNKEIKTPHFDAFAKSGTTFLKAYCQAAVCAPSRASVMTGLRPDSTRVWDLRGKFRVNLPEVVTIPQHFHKHGYYTVSMGKIFHNHMPDRISFDEPDLRPAKYMTPEMIDREPESFYHDDELNRELAEVRNAGSRRIRIATLMAGLTGLLRNLSMVQTTSSTMELKQTWPSRRCVNSKIKTNRSSWH